ncbi:efflux RND transporter periplasmic adaptor subunit [Psychrobacter pacificensis]|uniref:efflux RND transporter periplasmic adaptor subunit n=1 Tax=Psychrobacter pacificensis TaxID=112002 RepID=UPI001CBA7D2E|nr:efflux RND transporter periplasmic adaptor subunit [Psychrobacter pacificensis]MBZ1392439.1 efflux RND transporter periplasmic adaptor subunit [Psychrobacter pacificensis]MDE0843692.1 efflux RND transporter periplasmic adaptor subunit [Psychrobacter pacificensis]
MSDFKDPDNKQEPTSGQQTNIETPQHAELPPYRQSDALSKNSPAKMPLWLLPALVAVLVIGVVLGKYWGGSADELREEPVASSGVAGGDEADSTASTEQSVLSVETVSPSQDDIGRTLSADGTINAKDIASVSAKVSGVAIERVLVEEGDRVRAGQVLAMFDTDAMEQQVLQAEADVAEAEATLANASADAARVLPLIDIDAISKQEADRYRTSEVRARAALQASKARLSNQRLTLDNATVVAPVSGIISEKMIEVGQVAGGEPLFTIIKDGILEWRAELDPKLVGDINIGTPVRVALPGDDSVMGEVNRIAPTADNNRQITIYASLAANSKIRAGMYQTGEFLLGSASTQTIPNSAIVSNDGYDYVMLVTDLTTTDGKSMGRIKQQRVTLGERLGENVAVLEPLPSDSHIVQQGGSFLNDGDLVRIVNGVGQGSTAVNTAAQAQS